MRAKVYCEGSLLEAVQRSRLFADCKHFVDMPLKTDAGGWQIKFSSSFKNPVTVDV